ncbi:MAG: BON domain-containing protein [Thermoguttaceae bacterium]|nr:BON domain-containing protein [Thermoguttaceae bacterium]MDW8078974.1 BON domain-containing protein [Thermoguttaceae bacterium]
MNSATVGNLASSALLADSVDSVAHRHWSQESQATTTVIVPEAAGDGSNGTSDLEKRIARALFRNPYLPKHHLRFETHAGRVILRGVVRSYFQKQMAQEAVRKVEGVQEICNELEVVG